MRIVCALRDTAQPVQETRKKKTAENAQKKRKRDFMVRKVEKEKMGNGDRNYVFVERAPDLLHWVVWKTTRKIPPAAIPTRLPRLLKNPQPRPGPPGSKSCGAEWAQGATSVRTISSWIHQMFLLTTRRTGGIVKPAMVYIIVVNQDAILFNDTIANNIAYGCPGATREEIIEAAKLANAHEFITDGRHPLAYDAEVGDKGFNLSGGEKQRVAIARAILRNPPILILDEATSALDTVTEKQVQEALNHVMVNRTVFAIAHRLSTI